MILFKGYFTLDIVRHHFVNWALVASMFARALALAVFLRHDLKFLVIT